MTAEVDICNLALSHLGDVATVTSIDPPEGSAQAQHCAVFYPVARNTLLELHDWGFATTRVQLTPKQEDVCGWRYVYASPADVLRVIWVKPAARCNDESGASVPYLLEAGADGGGVILCNSPEVMLRYTVLVTDVNRYPPLFVMALSWHLASMLAGPILKGDTGAAMAQQCANMAQFYLGKAQASDANQGFTDIVHKAQWIEGRH